MQLPLQEIVLLLFATIGPLKVTIVCAALTAEAPSNFVRQVAWRSVLIASVVCLAFALAGEVILLLFSVSIPAFQIGGAIIVLLFSIEMVMGKDKSENGSAGTAAKGGGPSLNIATYPLAIPLMASVSGLVAIVSVLAQSNDLYSVLFLAAAIVAIMAINYCCLRACRLIVNAVGPVTLQVVGKLMGVILTALAVELLLKGLIGLGIIARNAPLVSGGLFLSSLWSPCPLW